MDDDKNEWLNELPVNRYGRRMLTLEKARQIAIRSPASWCIAAYGLGYTIAKQTAYPGWSLYYVVDQNNEPLRFDDLDAAMRFLRIQLHVHDARILPVASSIIETYRASLAAGLQALRLRENDQLPPGATV